MIKKYKWKCRILLVKTPNYNHFEYKKVKKLYQSKIKKFHKRYIKVIYKIVKARFSIDLIDFDGVKKTTYKTFDPQKIFKKIDKVSLSQVLTNKRIKPLNLTLFSDHNPKTTTYGLGFKDKKKALYTLKSYKK